MTEPSTRAPAPPGEVAAAAPMPANGGHPAPPVFHAGAFVLVTAAIVVAVGLLQIVQAFFGDRMALPTPLAAGLTAATTGGLAMLVGAAVGARYRRLAFFEVFAASMVWAVITVALVIWCVKGWSLPLAFGRSMAPPAELQALYNQGAVVLVLVLLGVGGLAATAVFIGSSGAYLLAGTGRLEPLVSYELFIARSHLRLTRRTLLVLLAFAVVGSIYGFILVLIVLGVLGVVIGSLVRGIRERAAYRRGELVRARGLPATMLMTFFSIAAVALGVWTLVVVLSVMSGFSQDLKSKILGHTAHGMVLSYGQDDFGDWRDARRKTLAVKGVAGATPFTYSEVMLSSAQNLSGAALKGIDPASVGSVVDLPQSMQTGKVEWLAHPDRIATSEAEPGREDKATSEAPPDAPSRPRTVPGILLGKQLALSLHAGVGDLVNVLSPFGDLGPSGPQPKSRPFRVAGIFYSGMYEYDSKFAYIDLAEAQRFFGLQSVTGLEVKVKDVDAARSVMDRVVFALGQWPYYAKDWSDLNRSLFAALQQEKVVMAVILGFMVLVTTFTIIATLIMMVLEKRREIAVLMSMGANVPSIMRIFVFEGLVIGGIGVALGLVLGLGTCLVIDKVGIPLNPEIYYIHHLPVLVDGVQVTLVAVAALVFSYLATLYPASKAARLHPVDGLRSE